MSDLVYNPYDAATRHDPYPIYRRMRDEAPVYRNEEFGFYALTRYEDVLNGLLDPYGLISSEGILIDGADKGGGFLINQDPPEHTWYRKVMSRVFTRKEIARLEPFVRKIASEYLDAIRGEREFDVIESLALPLPLDVISELLGIAPELRGEIHELSNRQTARGEDDTVDKVSDDVVAAITEYRNLLLSIVQEHRRQPQDDLITMLIDATVADDAGNTWKMTDEQIASQMQLLAFAGHETLTSLIGNGTVALWWYPDQRRELVADPSLIPGAVEEMVRWDNPVPQEGRWTTRDLELHGTVIPKDSRVVLLMGSANHDERVYDEPELFDIHRTIERPLGFGFGMHLCLGANLARLTARVAFEEFLARFPDYDVDEAGIVRGDAPALRGLRHLPVSVGPRP